MNKVMSMEDALKKASELMTNAATHYAKDKDEKQYTAQLHVRSAGLALRVLFQPKEVAVNDKGEQTNALEYTAGNLTAVFHALYNHSAWRQKFEKQGLFAKAAKTSEELINSLEEELGE